MKKRILFLCTHNSARSQMAEGLANTFLSDFVIAESAGTIETGVKKIAVDVMAEIGIDISTHRSKTVDIFKDDQFDIVVTVCDNAKESCPFFPGRVVIHRNFRDPSETKGTDEEIYAAFRFARDEIRDWLETEFKKIVILL